MAGSSALNDARISTARANISLRVPEKLFLVKNLAENFISACPVFVHEVHHHTVIVGVVKHPQDISALGCDVDRLNCHIYTLAHFLRMSNGIHEQVGISLSPSITSSDSPGASLKT